MNLTEFLFMLIPALVALGGGVLAMYWHPSHQMRSLIQHFAAGVVLAALAVELLPEIGREHAPGSGADCGVCGGKPVHVRHEAVDDASGSA